MCVYFPFIFNFRKSPIWPAPFGEDTVHVFGCCAKALGETRAGWKLSILLQWVARELELDSCHTPIELVSFINYFPRHLEQEWCHGLEKRLVGYGHIQRFCNLLLTHSTAVVKSSLVWRLKMLINRGFCFKCHISDTTSTPTFSPSLSPF